MKVDYQGAPRFARGSVHYATPPEPGTIVGPNDTGELMVVLDTTGARTWLGYATVPDIDAARAVVAERGPRSVAEMRLPQ